MKDFSKYYTPQKIAASLMRFVDFNDNDSVIDICCGKGNLLFAAKNYNPSLQCFGVDIADINIDWCKTTKKDGREFALGTKRKYTIALANPPFGKIESISYASKLFVEKYASINSKRIEIEMLIANLNLLKEDGILLIILPNTFINGVSYKKIRKTISENHFVKTIIKLPPNAFSPERINCSAIVICKKKNNENQACTYYTMNEKFNISNSYEIKHDNILQGCWSNNVLYEKVDFKINRGNISSNMFSEKGIEVLHTSKKSSPWQPSLRYIKKGLNTSNSIIAEKGDLIISRIGSSAGCLCLYEGDPKYITDCLMLIKSPNKQLIKHIQNLNLRSLVKGVSTPHITVSDIYDLYNSTYNNL
jgi:type I restriction-modification system DNA methylase subunit